MTATLKKSVYQLKRRILLSLAGNHNVVNLSKLRILVGVRAPSDLEVRVVICTRTTSIIHTAHTGTAAVPLKLMPFAAVPPLNKQVLVGGIKLYGPALVYNVDIAVADRAERLFHRANLLEPRHITMANPRI
jgi:hypothetical protein